MKSPESIYISYARADGEFVQKFSQDLREAGADIWLDMAEINPGSNFVDSIRKAVESAFTVIAVLSPNAIKADFVMEEISMALDIKKRVIPVLILACELPVRLSRMQAVDFTKDYDKGLETLLVALGLRVAVPMALRLIEDNKKNKSVRLDLSECGMTEIPAEIGELVWLEELIIAGEDYYDLQQNRTVITRNNGGENAFHEFPPAIAKLKKLKKLVFSCDEKPLSPENIDFLTNYSNLRYLDISRTGVRDISVLSGLQKLTYLNIGRTLISDLSVISQLVNLISLNMPYTLVTDTSPLSSLLKLRQLNMAGNRIQDISKLYGLINLEQVDINGCNIKDIHAIASLANLNVLNFSANPVGNIGPVLKLAHLRELSFSFTKINSLTGLESLKNLTSVFFTNCDVVSLAQLVPLENLEKFDCSGNPIADCPADVYETGDAKQLRTYFNAKKEEETLKETAPELSAQVKNTEGEIDLRRDVKLIVLGNSNVGKTNLVNYLETGHFTGNRKTTHGLEVHRWIPDKQRFPALQDIAVSIWDFGGQEYYHEAYRLFLSSNAVYLLLWCKESDRNCRQNTCLNDTEPTVELQHFEINYWLDTIQHYTGNNKTIVAPFDMPPATAEPTEVKKAATSARLIAVQNKVDEIERDKKRIAQELHEKYKISDSFHISLLKGSEAGNLQQNKRLTYFLSELESAIVNNADIEKPPAKWQQVRRYILSLKDGNAADNPFQQVSGDKPWISLDDFRKACESLPTPLTEDEAYTLPRWLDKGGVVVYFPDIAALADKIFLRPDNLAADIYNILSEKIRLKGGEFSADDLFTPDEKERKAIFLELAKQLDLVFPHPVKTSGEFYLAPQYLPDNHPIEDLFKIASQGAWQSQLWIKVPLFYYKKILHGLLLHFASEPDTDCRYFWKHGIMFVNEGLRVLIKGLYPDSLQQEGIILFGVEYSLGKREALQKKIFDQVLRLLAVKPTSGTTLSNTISNTISTIADLKTSRPVVDILVSYDGENYISYNALLDNAGEPKIKAANNNTWLITHNFAAIMPSPPQKAKRVFLSYSHQNTKWLGRLRTHLAGIRRAKMIETWDDKEILPGDQWDTIIKKNLEEADIFILLLSADFIASEYIWNEELRTAFRTLKERNAMVIPILFEPLDLGGLSEIAESADKTSYKISDFEIIPKNIDGRLQAVSLWQNQEEALALVAERIRDAIQKKG